MEKGLSSADVLEQLQAIFEQELNTKVNDIDENFFAMGGNSIIAVKILQQIKKAFYVSISFQDIFEHPTVKLLADRILELKIAGNSNCSKAPIAEYNVAEKEFPLTPIQKAYLLGREASMGSYGVSSHFYIELERCELDIDALESAWNILINKYEALRLVLDKKNMTQFVMENVPRFCIQYYDLDSKENEFLKLRKQMETQVLDVEHWPVFDIRVSKSVCHKFCIHISFDNLILDGSSICFLLDEWEKLYNGNDYSAISKSDWHFRDYVESISRIKNTENYRKSEAFWNEKIKSIPGKPQLPVLDKNITGEFYRNESVLSAEKWSNIKSFAIKYSLTPSSILLTAFAEVLYRWGSEKKFTINVTANKKGLYDNAYDAVLGEFTDIVLVSVSAGDENTFIDKCKAVQNEVVKNMNYGYFDGLEVQRIWTKENKASLGTAFPVVFTSMLGSADSLSMPGKYIYGLTQTPQVWLDYQVREYKGKLYFNWDVLKGKYDICMIRQMFECYQRILEDLAEGKLWESAMKSHATVSNEMISKNTVVDAAILSDDSLYEYFKNSFIQTPENVAVIFDGVKYTYEDCQKEANPLAIELLHSKKVGIFLEKGIRQIESVIAASMAGATYIPIDVNNPDSRVHTIIKEANIEVVITSRILWKQMESKFDVKCIYVEDTLQPSNECKNVDMTSKNSTAYIIFTSGSTGVPKGVVVSNRAVKNTISDINKRYSVDSADRVLALSNIAFDLSVYDIFGMFEAGAAIVLPCEEDIKNPNKWIELIEENSVSIWNSVPTFMDMLCTYIEMNEIAIERLSSVRLVLLSGDKISNDLPKRISSIMPEAHIICLGGATEAAIWSNYYEPKEINMEWPSIPYGYPLTNQKYYILNEDLLICPEYVEGELCIAGVGLADGYLNDKKLTDSKFPYVTDLKERIYRTGDRGKCVDGCIWFLGRQDTQIKKRGYRIELGEVENALQSIEYVKQAKVGYKDNKIYAFACVRKGIVISSAEIMDDLEQKIPKYYLPDVICIVDDMPLNKNGKIDLKQLWTKVQKRDTVTREDYHLTDLEKSIGIIWKNVLKYKNDFSRNDDFFHCGGDSLRAVEVISQINKSYPNVELEIKDIFLNSTIKSLSTEIENRLVESSLLDEGTI